MASPLQVRPKAGRLCGKTMKQFSELAIKIFAAYLALSNLGNVIPLFFSPAAWGTQSDVPIWPLIGWLGIPLMVGFVLWFSASTIAQKAIGNGEEGTSLSEGGLVAAGTFLIGTYWALRSVGVVVGQLSSVGTVNYGYIMVFAISLLLIFGNKAITRMYRKLRTVGVTT
ncbi:hypothetical protein AUP74_02317 [Microbulbifer aggregans]|uniref:Uncharacterized protein n=1 Tax=Microbulbifer aggregans TaxID=1769779 RepID=A0A1C9W9C0_9GAMM|nr:hypothetical protein [Microbulbifer aggregans]AOS97725.1 hypothetical protein AUP74_02317 [Microbulbifer aggregans]